MRGADGEADRRLEVAVEEEERKREADDEAARRSKARESRGAVPPARIGDGADGQTSSHYTLVCR